MAMLCALSSQPLARALRPFVAQRLSTSLERPVTIERLTVVALPPTFIVDHLHVGPKKEFKTSGDQSVWTVQRMRIVPGLWPLLSARRLTLQEVEVDGVSVELEAQAVRATKTSSAPPKLALPIDIRHFVLRDAQLSLTDATARLEMSGLEAEVSPTGWRGRSVALGCARAQLRWRGMPSEAPALLFAAHLSGHLNDSLAQPSALMIDQAEISHAGLALGLEGEVDLKPAVPQLRLAVTVHGPLDAELMDLVPAMSQWRADVELNAHLLGAANAPQLSGELGLRQWMAPNGKHLGHLDVNGQLSPHALLIERAIWQLPDLSAESIIRGSGQWRLSNNWPFQLNLKLEDVSWSRVMGLLSKPDGSFKAHASGRVALTGEWTQQPVAHMRLDTRLDGVAVEGRAQPNQSRRPVVWAPGALRLAGDMTVNRELVSTSGLDITGAAGRVQVTGELGFKTSTAPFVRAVVKSDALALESLGPIAGLKLSGSAATEARLTGALAHLAIEAPFQARDLWVGPIGLGQSEGFLRYEGQSLNVQPLRIKRTNGSGDGQFYISWASKTPMIKTRFNLHGLEARELAQALGVPVATANLLGARLWGGMHAQGPLLRPRGQILLKTPQLIAADVPLGPAELAVELATPTQRLGATLKVSIPVGQLFGQVDWHDDNSLAVSAQAQDVPLALFTTLNERDVQGRLHADVTLRGPPELLKGQVHVAVPQIRVSGTPLGALRVALQVEDDVTLEAQALDRALRVRGSIGRAAALPAQLVLTAEKMRIPQLGLIPGLNLPAWVRDAAVVLTGRSRFTGPLTQPDRADVVAQISGLQADWRGFEAHLTSAVRPHLSAGRLNLDTWRFRGRLIEATLKGEMPISARAQDGPLALALTLRSDLALAQAFSHELDAAHGLIQLKGTMTGRLDRPNLLGEAEISDGTLRWHKSDHPIEHLALRAIFSGRAVAITQGSATLGRGTLRLLGEAQSEEGGWADMGRSLSLRLALNHVPIAPSPELVGVVSGNLEVTGGQTSPALVGELRLESLRYTAKVDLDRLVPKRAAPPLRAPLLSGLPTLRLRVHLFAPNNLIVSSSVLESEMGADLTVTGTTERVGLLGSITPLWARARWRNNTFVLSRANIDFIDEFRLAPQFSVRAHTEACNMQAEVLIEGGVDHYSVLPTGRDERGVVDPQDVLACLQLGLRLRDFDGNQRGGATVTDALSSSLDALWTVSGLDDKVRKLLPIGVDEIRLTSGWSSLGQRTTARVLVGKDLGKHLALRYSRSLDEYNDQAFSLDYQVTERATMQGNWVSTRDVPVGDLGLDLRLHWEVL